MTEGLGVAEERVEHMFCSSSDCELRNFVDGEAALRVPPHQACMNLRCMLEGVVSLGVGSVDLLPGRKHEDRTVEAERSKLNLKLSLWKRGGLLDHSERLDGAAIKEDDLTFRRKTDVLELVSTEEFSSERGWLGARRVSSDQTLGDEFACRLADGGVAAAR